MSRALRVILVVGLTSLLVSGAWARGHYGSSSLEHSFGIYAEVGLARIGDGLQHKTEQSIAVNNGYAVEGGILYEMQKRHFLFDLGCGFRWQVSGLTNNEPLVWTEPRTDTQGTDYTLKTIVLRSDWLRRGDIEIPILFGGDWNPFYLLGGVKVGVGVLGKPNLHAQISTEGIYDAYFVPISETDNHGYRNNVPLDQAGDLALKLDVRAHLELGSQVYRFDTDAAGVRVRLGLYADYGFFTQTYGINAQPLATNGEFDYDRFTMTPILETGSFMLSNLSVGLKLTVLIQGNQQDNGSRCLSCRIWGTDFKPKRHKKKCIICDY